MTNPDKNALAALKAEIRLLERADASKATELSRLFSAVADQHARLCSEVAKQVAGSKVVFDRRIVDMAKTLSDENLGSKQGSTRDANLVRDRLFAADDSYDQYDFDIHEIVSQVGWYWEDEDTVYCIMDIRDDDPDVDLLGSIPARFEVQFEPNSDKVLRAQARLTDAAGTLIGRDTSVDRQPGHQPMPGR